MKSLRSRLLWASVLALCVFSLGWGIFMTWWMWWEEKGFADSSLRGTAQLIMQSMPEDCRIGAPAFTPRTPSPPVPDDMSLGMDFEVWCQGQPMVRSPGTKASSAPSDEGFLSASVAGQARRSYVLQAPQRNLVVRVSRDQSTHGAMLVDTLGFGFLNAGLLLIPLMLALSLAVHWSFGPVRRLRAALLERSPLSLEPLPEQGLTTELQPLVQAFNNMLSRQQLAIEQERRFIADAAHELRTPLAVLAAQAHVARRASDPHHKDQALAQLAEGVERSAWLSEQLLSLARVDASSPQHALHEVVNLGELAAMLARDCAYPMQQKRQHLRLNIEPAMVWGDLEQLGILVRNLLDNAITYGPAGGQIECDLNHSTSAPQAADCDSPAGWVRLHVADDGPGVDPSLYAHLFERFYRVPGNPQAGSGIGLSLVARIAQFHGAHVELGPGLNGRGLGVTVWLPAWLDPSDYDAGHGQR